MDRKMISTSRWMSYALRHGTTELGLQTHPGGWVKLSELEACGKACEMEIITVLQHDITGRYEAFCERGEFWIRASPPRRRGSLATELPFPRIIGPALPPPPPPPPMTLPTLPHSAPMTRVSIFRPSTLTESSIPSSYVYPRSLPSPILRTTFGGGHASSLWNGNWCPQN